MGIRIEQRKKLCVEFRILSVFTRSFFRMPRLIVPLLFVYTKEYKGFQLNFSPPVNKRNLNLVIGTRQGTVLNYLLAPLYSVGLIHSTKNRLITSPSVTLGVAGLVAIVKGLNPIWRCIMDAGVVVDLTWGSLSILVIFFQFRSIR